MIEARKHEAVDALTSRHTFDWRSLGVNQVTRRQMLARAMNWTDPGTIVRLIERLGITSEAVAADD